MECRRFTGECCKYGAARASHGFVMCTNAQFSRMFLSDEVQGYEKTPTVLVKILVKTAADKGLADCPSDDHGL